MTTTARQDAPAPENPYHRLVCETCRDARRIAEPREGRGSIPCPACADDSARTDLFRRRALVPELHLLDVTPEELALFHEWRARGYHKLDCLRWLEGRRYDPAKDPVFLADCEAHLAAWRERTGPTKPEHEVSAPARIAQKPAPRAPAPHGAIPQGGAATQAAAPGVEVRNGRESSANAEKAPDSTESNLGVEESAECRKIATPGEDSDAPPF